MGITKREGYDTEILIKADLFKAFGHPARLTIIRYLVQRPGANLEEIKSEIDLNPATTDHHVSSLLDAGAIRKKEVAPEASYHIDRAFLDFIIEELECIREEQRLI